MPHDESAHSSTGQTWNDVLPMSFWTPAAILCATLLFGAVHAVGSTGSAPVTLLDVARVAFDGAFFGIVYAKTHSLALTWATHYAADVIGALTLAFIL